MLLNKLSVSEQIERALNERWLCRGMRPQDAPSDVGFMTLGGKSSISEVRYLRVLSQLRRPLQLLPSDNFVCKIRRSVLLEVAYPGECLEVGGLLDRR